jgi:hypothetical protein
MRWLVALGVLVACKERGTITVPMAEPCGAIMPEGIAVYLLSDVSCADVTCPQAIDCTRSNCIPLCAHETQGDLPGYCAPDKLPAIDPPASGDYSLVLSYRYQGQTSDEGVACFHLHIDADGTRSETLPMASDAGTEAWNQCCMGGP